MGLVIGLLLYNRQACTFKTIVVVVALFNNQKSRLILVNMEVEKYKRYLVIDQQ